MQPDCAFALLLFATVLTSPSYADAATLKDLSTDLRSTAQCMANVAKTVNGVYDVRIIVEDSSDPFAPQLGPWVHPIVEYSVIGREGPSETDFVAQRSMVGGHNYFRAGMSGITTVGQPADDLKSNTLMPLWKKRCGVSADALYN